MCDIYLSNYEESKLKKIGDIIQNNEIDYKLESFLGVGNFGVVFKSKTSVNEYVAIKIIDKDKLIDDKSSDDENENLKRIKNEIYINSKLKHTNIVDFKNMFQDNTNIYIVLELLKGSIYDIIYNSTKSVSEKCIINIIINIIIGLKYLKENLIIHRDIKAENILISSDNNIKIADFGFAIQLNNSDEKVTGTFGTLNYLSPEIVNDDKYSFETDVWSLGILFYELKFKKVPFDSCSRREIYRLIKGSNPVYLEEIDPKIKNTINSMLEKDGTKRASLDQVLEYLS